jgi:hypothetical protein
VAGHCTTGAGQTLVVVAARIYEKLNSTTITASIPTSSKFRFMLVFLPIRPSRASERTTPETHC